MWNALKLIKGWESRTADNVSESNVSFAMDWMEQRVAHVGQELNGLFREFRLSEALKTIYSLIWDDFCSWYLEWVKPGFEQSIDETVYNKSIGYFEQLVQLLHPFMPFISEEIYHLLKEQKDDLCIKQFSAIGKADQEILKQGSLLRELITGIRDAKNKNQIRPKDRIKLHIQSNSPSVYKSIENILSKQVNAEEIRFVTQPVSNCINIVVQKDKLFIETGSAVDTSSQKTQLLKELEYHKGFLLSVEKKLGNERFVQNAKSEVIDIERKKKADAEAKIRAIEESLAGLN